jgi:hypothetical protein
VILCDELLRVAIAFPFGHKDVLPVKQDVGVHNHLPLVLVALKVKVSAEKVEDGGRRGRDRG